MRRQFAEQRVIDPATERHRRIIFGFPRRRPLSECRVVLRDRSQFEMTDVLLHVPRRYRIGTIVDQLAYRVCAVVVFDQRFRESTVKQALRSDNIAQLAANRIAAGDGRRPGEIVEVAHGPPDLLGWRGNSDRLVCSENLHGVLREYPQHRETMPEPRGQLRQPQDKSFHLSESCVSPWR